MILVVGRPFKMLSLHEMLACLLAWSTVAMAFVNGVTLAPVYWNSSNPMRKVIDLLSRTGLVCSRCACGVPNQKLYEGVKVIKVGKLEVTEPYQEKQWNIDERFKTSKNLHVIEVNLFDEIDFVCPYFPPGTEESLVEYYIISQVTQQEYDDCTIYSDNSAVMIVNCSNPNQKKRFTILFESFQSIPNVPEYKSGGSYYYITTSTGQREGLMNTNLGACYERNMKLIMKVCCDFNTYTELPNIAMATTKSRKNKQDQIKADVKSRVKNSHVDNSIKDSSWPKKKNLPKNLHGGKDELENLPTHQGLQNESNRHRARNSLLACLCLTYLVLIGYITR